MFDRVSLLPPLNFVQRVGNSPAYSSELWSRAARSPVSKRFLSDSIPESFAKLFWREITNFRHGELCFRVYLSFPSFLFRFHKPLSLYRFTAVFPLLR